MSMFQTLSTYANYVSDDSFMLRHIFSFTEAIMPVRHMPLSNKEFF